jgi:hypothetical protein
VINSSWNLATVGVVTPPTATLSAVNITSQTLKSLNFPFTLPSIPIAGVQVLVTGSQTAGDADDLISVQLQLPSGTLSPTIHTGQLPLVSGPITLGALNDMWGLDLTAALLNDPNFTVDIVATADEDVTFVVSDVQLLVWLAGPLSGNPSPANINYIKTFTEGGGEISTFALASTGTIYQEEVRTNPGVLNTAYTAVQLDTFAQSATIDSREFMVFSNLRTVTRIPMTATPQHPDVVAPHLTARFAFLRKFNRQRIAQRRKKNSKR